MCVWATLIVVGPHAVAAEPGSPALQNHGDVLTAEPKTGHSESSGIDLSAGKAVPRAAAKTVAILILSREEIGVPLSEIHANARSVIEANTALTVAPFDVIGIAEREAAIRDCAGSGKCFADKVRASASNVSLLLTVSADRLDEGFLLGFRLVDVETRADLGASGGEIPAGMSVLGAMEQQLPGVFPASIWGQIAALTIESEPANAEVTVAGRLCASPCQLSRVPPGTYDMTIKKSGYLPWQGTVTLIAKDTRTVSATLEEPQGGVTSKWWFWTLLGIAAVGGATAAILALQPSDGAVNICIAPKEDERLCK